MRNKVGLGLGYLLIILVVAIGALLYASHEFFPPFNPAGGTSATK